jgi:hypothetical protein
MRRLWVFLSGLWLMVAYPQGEWVASGAGETRTQTVAVLDERAKPVTHTALVVVGAGEPSTYWRNTQWELQPNRTYAFRVRLKGEGRGGCAIVGANVVNRDYIPSREWQTVGYVFRTPSDTREAFIRVGHWQWRGEVMFAQPEFTPVDVVHARYGDLLLGAGERIQGNRYRFLSQFEGELSNAQAPLKAFTAVFNTNRWVFSPDAHVIYRHALGARRIRRATLSLNVSYEQDGVLAVQFRADGGEWHTAATIRGLGAHTVQVPDTLLPARTLEVRLEGQAGVIQVDRYELQAELARPVAQPLVGRSLVLYPDWQRADWQVMPLALIRGAQGEWLLLAEVTNRSRTPARLQAFYEGDTRSISVFLGSQLKPLQPNEPRTLTIPLPQEPTGTAEQKIGFQREPFGEIVWSARIEYRSHFLEWSHYGYRLKGAPAWAGLWWCEWGWKVGRTRELPRETRDAVRLSAARGEYEPVQIVLRPTQPLRLLRAEPSDLRAGRHRIPARHITLREVAYVPVEYPTDTLGAIDDYPDPLPPLQTPLTLAAGQNQPLWLTVYVPYGTPAGVYKGTLTLRTSRGALTVPLEVTVYDFDLPRVPSLRSGFGISAERIFQYHKVDTDAQKRELWDRYMQAFRRARLSPYTFSLEPYQVRLDNGRVVLDFEAFDRAAKRYLDEFGFNSFVLPVYGLPGGRYPNYSTAEFLGFKEGTPEYERYWTDYMRQLQEHLRQRGWLRKAYIYWFDEPEEADYPFVRRVNEQIKRAAPDLTIMLTEQPEPPLMGDGRPVVSADGVRAPKVHRRAAQGRRGGLVVCLHGTARALCGAVHRPSWHGDAHMAVADLEVRCAGHPDLGDHLVAQPVCLPRPPAEPVGRPDELCVGREFRARHAPVLGQRRRQATLSAPTRPERQRRADDCRPDPVDSLGVPARWGGGLRVFRAAGASRASGGGSEGGCAALAAGARAAARAACSGCEHDRVHARPARCEQAPSETRVGD